MSACLHHGPPPESVHPLPRADAPPALTNAHDAPAATIYAGAHSVTDALFAQITPCPTSSGTPNVVHVVIHTTVTIQDYARYYTVPISEFQPSYVALADGSLLSPVFTPNLRVSESWLLMGGAFCVFFAFTAYKSLMYARIVDVKNKSLFYMLCVSQAIGLFVSIFFVVADFDPTLDCTATGMIKKGGVLISTTLLVPGILGVKAYRCLSNAGFVVVFLVLIRAAIIAVAGTVLVQYKGGRRFIGTCETVYESPLLPVSVALQLIESLFICMCFMWAVYRSYRSPTDHARLSLTVQDDETSTVDMGDKDDGPSASEARRGWWDYVPDGGADNKTGDRGPPSPAITTPRDLVDRLRQWWTGAPVLPSTVFQRKPSTPGEVPIPAPRISSASGANALSLRLSTSRDAGRPRPSSPPPPSVMERIIRYVPRAELFRNMLRNELLYTTFLTSVLLVIAVVMWFGITQHLLLGANSWLMLDWVIISTCTMHSFSRVAHRHEREAWLQNPDNWRSIHLAEVEDRTTLRPKNSRRPWSPVSVSSNWRQRHQAHRDSDGIYSMSGYRPGSPPDPLSLAGPSRVRSSSFSRTQSQSHGGAGTAGAVSRSTSVISSPMPSMDSIYRPPHVLYHGSPVILPSPEYPPTNASTPHSSDRRAMISRAASVAPQSPPRSPPPSGCGPCSPPRSSAGTSLRSPPPPHWDPENPEPPDPAVRPR